MSQPINWPYVRQNAWRFQGGPKWSREMRPLEIFLAQSNASGPARIFGLFLTMTADALFDRVASPLLERGMRGDHLGLDAHPLSVTALAWRASNLANDLRWRLERWACHFARYNR